MARKKLKRSDLATLARQLRVIEATEGHPHGHTAMYDGSKWISDFVQRDMFGSDAFRNKEGVTYNIYRK